jgi:hypothetical protein
VPQPRAGAPGLRYVAPSELNSEAEFFNEPSDSGRQHFVTEIRSRTEHPVSREDSIASSPHGMHNVAVCLAFEPRLAYLSS